MRGFLYFLAAGLLAATLSACDASSDEPDGLLGPDQASLSIIYDTVNAMPSGHGYEILPYVMAGDCGPHANCPNGPLRFTANDVEVEIDAHTSWYWDAAIFSCNGGGADTIFSSDSCWYCRYGCEDPYYACNGEEACILEQGAEEGDCRGYDCPAGYDMIQGYGLREVPQCVKAIQVADPEVEISGPSQIMVDEDECTWTANMVSGTAHIYTWYYDGSWQKSGSDNTYTGGVLSGDLNDEFWLKVIARDTTLDMTDSYQMLVQESASARPCFH